MTKSSILVTGGAGYIGSHVVEALINNDARVVVLDNLSTGFEAAILSPAKFIQGDVQDLNLLLNIFESEKVDSVIHLAAHTVIADSLKDPLKYYQNNTFSTLQLLKACASKKIKNLIFSSTAAVYGEANSIVDEQSSTKPLNPYGYSKLMSEQLIKDAANASDLKYIILRYFNVAGASLSGKIGQNTIGATHLIKVAVETAAGLRSSMPIYGNQYPTPDGTCIRDFIHVNDVANAHVQALNYLQQGGKSLTLNCGYGKGFSVLEVVKALEFVTKAPLAVHIASPRKGDIAKVVADNNEIKKRLAWQPQCDDIQLIVKSALEWEKSELSQKLK